MAEISETTKRDLLTLGALEVWVAKIKEHDPFTKKAKWSLQRWETVTASFADRDTGNSGMISGVVLSPFWVLKELFSRDRGRQSQALELIQDTVSETLMETYLLVVLQLTMLLPGMNKTYPKLVSRQYEMLAFLLNVLNTGPGRMVSISAKLRSRLTEPLLKRFYISYPLLSDLPWMIAALRAPEGMALLRNVATNGGWETKVTISAINALADLCDQEFSQTVTRLFSKREPDIRMAAAEALVTMKHPDAVPALIALLGDPVPEIATVVVELLKGCARPDALPLLKKMTGWNARGPKEVKQRAKVVVRHLQEKYALH